MNRQQHWQEVYGSKSATEVSWYRPHLERSLHLIQDCGVGTAGSLIDVGAGASTLVDDLLDAGFGQVTVLDVSESAIEGVRSRLGSRAASVNWIVGDVLTVDLPADHYDLWHDRAVFHFLTSEDDRTTYVRRLNESLRPQGQLVMATFGPDGPTQCSGLDVVRYSAESLGCELGPEFHLTATEVELHQTPWGSTQSFTYCRFQRQ
jgi:2-polyprenyl-3-methyl-5-hydroxy-6-metoxy-1,4-benzoquinol methylase